MDATMLKVDEAILESNKIICRQISRLGTSTRGEVSQEILESLRHFVEHIILKEYVLRQYERNSCFVIGKSHRFNLFYFQVPKYLTSVFDERVAPAI